MHKKPKPEKLHDFYFYHRNDDNVIESTFCFLTDGQFWSIGRAYRSPADNPCKKTGRRIAKSRALKAFFTEKDEVRQYPDAGTFESAWWMPTPLTRLETRFLRAVNRPKNNHPNANPAN